LPVVHGDRDALILGPRLRDDGGGRRDERGDRVEELGRDLLHPVQTFEPQARHPEQLGDLLGATTRDDAHDAENVEEHREDLANPLDRTRELWPLDDLGERAVEVEQDAGRGSAGAERAEISP
jgi:hypothetical protein